MRIQTTVAQWICLRLPSCLPGFESQARHLFFYQFKFELWHVEKTKINRKSGGDLPIFNKNITISLTFVSNSKKFQNTGNWSVTENMISNCIKIPPYTQPPSVPYPHDIMPFRYGCQWDTHSQREREREQVSKGSVGMRPLNEFFSFVLIPLLVHHHHDSYLI